MHIIIAQDAPQDLNMEMVGKACEVELLRKPII